MTADLLFCQVVVVLPSNRKDKYDNVKKFLCVDFPVPSQCVVARTLSRPQAMMTVATKIALQMACKMGGELWSVEIPVRCTSYQCASCKPEGGCGPLHSNLEGCVAAAKRREL